MVKENINNKALDDVYQNAQIAVNSIDALINKVKDTGLRRELKDEREGYEQIVVEATKAIRNLPGAYASGIPIIAMTANAFAEDCQAALEAGMNEHISKPVDIVKLRNILTRFLG